MRQPIIYFYIYQHQSDIPFRQKDGSHKTEVANQLSELLGLKLLRFDMSEYMEKHSASQLIGAPPGYVGFDQGGKLTDEVSKHPHCVLLLDEIEKAHHDLYNLLLQVMDYGHLTDNMGRRVDFRHCIILLTSNLGSEALLSNKMGFTTKADSSDCTKAINSRFTPEFRNRLNGILTFNQLKPKSVKLIVTKFLAQLETQLEQKNIQLKVDQKTVNWLAKKGFSKDMGARPMERLIDNEIKQKLANEILFGKLKNGGTTYLSTAKNQLKFRFVEKKRTKLRVLKAA